ncbi:hypothetical protein HZC34_03580 [Candidatus Saganbacteria bacterium]|nr:hypothetical protein [Candidatus Saganbacteria bacterium]
MSWKIRYSNHLRERIKIRELPYDLAKDILIYAIERYYDTITHYLIALGSGKYKGKKRNFAVVYKEDFENKVLDVVTIHPLKHGQKENRVISRRWVRK